MAEPQINAKKSGQPDDNPHFGFVFAGVFIVIGLVLFFGWENFGNETFLKLLGAFSLAFGLIVFGVEVTNKSNDDGGLEAGMGLASAFFILMFKDAVPQTPNFVLLIFFAFSLFAIGVSVSRLIPTSKNKLKREQIEKAQMGGKNSTVAKIYKVALVISQILGGIVSVVNFLKMIL